MRKYFVLFICIVLVILLFPRKSTEIVAVGEVPKAFNMPTTDLSIDNPVKRERKNPMESVVSEKTIYLTFDDGPSYLTTDILNILREENVVATFFVIGTHIYDYKDVVKRAYDDGHTVAIHSDTHNYKYIYSADENYFNDLKEIRSKVYNITGENSRIIRLPGGSSNTVSRNYNDKIVTRITDKLRNDDYYYFDWNVDSEDASGKIPADKIYSNVTSRLIYRNNVVLMHDAGSKKTTVLALRDIIRYGKENGYTFARITKDTQMIRHRVNN